MNSREKIAEFVSLYPDGLFIGIVGDRSMWLRSIRRHERLGELSTNLDAEILLGEWLKALRPIISMKEKIGNRVLIIKIWDLIFRTKSPMRKACS
jgi:hypothetical protein